MGRPAIAVLMAGLLTGLLAGLFVGGIASGAAGDDDAALTWSQSGRDDPARVEAGTWREHTVTLLWPSSPDDAQPAPAVLLACRDRDSGEEGLAEMPILGRAATADRLALTIATGGALAGLPYPVDPLAVASKPAAIIAQRSGRSVIGLDPARLRDLYREVEGYMLMTAGHHYPLPLGDGSLACRFESRGGATVLAGPPFELIVGRGAPDGAYPRDHDTLPLAARAWWIADPASLPAEIRDSIVASGASTKGDKRMGLDPGSGGVEGATAMRHWDDGSAVAPWMEVALDLVATGGLNPVRASRALAMVAVAANDVLLALDTARMASSEPTAAPLADPTRSGWVDPFEHAAVAAAVVPVLEELFGAYHGLIDEARRDASEARRLARISDVDQEAAAEALGRWVSQQVIARGRVDGSSATWNGQPPDDAGRWRSAIPNGPAPVEALAGTWQPWNLPSGTVLRPPEPPRPGDPTFERELREVADVTSGLTSAQQQIASQWQDKDGSLTPPGHWTAIAIELARRDGWSSSRTGLLMALLATAQADAFIAAWDAKFTYWSVRPVTMMQAQEPAWTPYMATPDFPSYVSGHAATSGAAATVLAALFPHHAEELTACGAQAAESRLLGGIHFRTDNAVGLEMGRKAAATALARVPLPDIQVPTDGDEPAVGCLWPAGR